MFTNNDKFTTIDELNCLIKEIAHHLMPTILITGGTGLTGSRLSSILVEKGYEVIVMSRDANKHSSHPNIRYAAWNVERQTIDVAAVQQADHIIHLAGAGVVDHPWTAAYRKKIADSRIQSISLLHQTLAKNPHRVQSFISASAIGWYGADKIPTVPFVENDPVSPGFLGDTCRDWEKAAMKMEALGIRVGILRTGIVLSKNGGALKEFLKPLRFGIAATIGNGKQVVSWIHIDDLCNMYLHLIENASLKGIFNAVAPQPVSNEKLTKELACIVHPRFHIHVAVPAFVLKVMMGARSIEVLKSTSVSADKIIHAGFHFSFPDISTALKNLIQKN